MLRLALQSSNIHICERKERDRKGHLAVLRNGSLSRKVSHSSFDLRKQTAAYCQQHRRYNYQNRGIQRRPEM